MEPHLGNINLDLSTLGKVTGLSVLGGVAYFWDRLRKGELKMHWALEMTGDILYSLTAGIAGWHAARGAGVAPDYAFSIALISGHLGARIIVLAQRALLEKIRQVFGLKEEK